VPVDPPGPSFVGDQPLVAEDCVNTKQIETGQRSRYEGPGFGDQVTAAQAKSLCAEIARSGWAGITLERALSLAPSLSKELRQAARAGLLRGLLAVVLKDKGCSEPPDYVRAEAQRYTLQFHSMWLHW
jgi:hypothetical protein